MSEADRLKWDAAHARPSAFPAASPFLIASERLLPRRGRALDLAGGSGRNALLLAEHGLEVTIADISEVALHHAAAQARARDLPLTCSVVDFDEGFPPGPWDALIAFNFLDRTLFTHLPTLLAQGGVFVFVQPTRRNLERHRRPSVRFLLEEGELRGLLPDALDVLQLEEGWGSNGRHEARLVARRRASDGRKAVP